MIISDLNYVEVVAETSKIEGGLTQIVDTNQRNTVSSGNNGRNGISALNVAAGVNANIPFVIGVEALNFR